MIDFLSQPWSLNHILYIFQCKVIFFRPFIVQIMKLILCFEKYAKCSTIEEEYQSFFLMKYTVRVQHMWPKHKGPLTSSLSAYLYHNFWMTFDQVQVYREFAGVHYSTYSRLGPLHLREKSKLKPMLNRGLSEFF